MKEASQQWTLPDRPVSFLYNMKPHNFSDETRNLVFLSSWFGKGFTVH